uniref:Zona pellucida sperm-binding protein 3 n=1 Tax=Denticeps clupeoides TaxID=299321 RepID=A0AAY3ZX96_9TELE
MVWQCPPLGTRAGQREGLHSPRRHQPGVPGTVAGGSGTISLRGAGGDTRCVRGDMWRQGPHVPRWIGPDYCVQIRESGAVMRDHAGEPGQGSGAAMRDHAGEPGRGSGAAKRDHAGEPGRGSGAAKRDHAGEPGRGSGAAKRDHAGEPGRGSGAAKRDHPGRGSGAATPDHAGEPARGTGAATPDHAGDVAATCDENMVHVQVKKDLFGSGELIRASDISLGGCGVTGEDSVAQLLYFQSYLQACGSQVVMTNDTLVYSFSLTYLPTAASNTSAPIVRTSGAVIGIECHYLRLHNVSSNALQPAWIPYAATKIAQELLALTKTAFQRVLHGRSHPFEASVKQYNHVPLRVFVDSCQVTPYPYAVSGGFQAHWLLLSLLPRTQDFKLQFQLEAFRFQQGDTGSLYITCVLKATAAASPTDAEHKACSFVGQKWAGAGGEDQLCSCCDGTCGSRKARDLTSVSGM